MSRVNKTKLYATALAEILSGPAFAKASAGEEKKIIDNFVKILVSAGLEKKSKEILDLAEKYLLAKQGKNKITFEIARRITAENRALLKQFVKEGDVVKEKVNHELIAGVKIIINNEKQFDNSMLSKLNNIL
ncbi:MAG: F0F1 ATP synthase subunit delta [Candidatus Staskawiczbacteria bacterium]|jgi:F0F1-type ATP synthase delta subunit